MNRFFKAIVAALLCMLSQAVFAKTPEQKLTELVWVVYCEDNTDLVAAHLVLSTIYNRAKSHEVAKLHKAASAPGQYQCYRIKPSAAKRSNKRFKQIEQMVVDFINKQSRPSTRARYFYNHKLVKRAALGRMKLAVVKVYGAHTYLA